MESRHVRNNRFWVRCDVTVVETTCRRVPATVPPSDLRRHLGDLLAGGVGADVTFEVGGETVAAHRAVLAARSPVFRAEFFGAPLKESAAAATPTTRVRIHGVEPLVFRAMLHFVYTDALPEIVGDAGKRMAMAQHLLVAADRYGVERLRSVCEFDLCMYAGEDVAVSTLVLAEQHGCHELKEECFKILESSGKCRELLVGDDLEHLASSSPSLLAELRARLGLDDLFVGNVERSSRIAN
jgi:speckle-type POZ protein